MCLAQLVYTITKGCAPALLERGRGRMGRGDRDLRVTMTDTKMTCIQHCYRCNLKYLLQVKGLLVQSKKSASGKKKITQRRKKEERNLMLIKRHKILMPSLLYHRNCTKTRRKKSSVQQLTMTRSKIPTNQTWLHKSQLLLETKKKLTTRNSKYWQKRISRRHRRRALRKRQYQLEVTRPRVSASLSHPIHWLTVTASFPHCCWSSENCIQSCRNTLAQSSETSRNPPDELRLKWASLSGKSYFHLLR